jgi:hypothetical protein
MQLKLYIEPYGPNTWTERLIQNMPHIKTSIEDCDYIVSSKIPYGCINPSLIQDILNSYKDILKKVLVFLLSDYNEPLDIPENVLFFRSGMYRSYRKQNEFLIPHIWSEDGMEGLTFNPLPKRGIHPIIGFCGSITSHPCRIKHLNKLNMSPNIKKKFIIRSNYWAGKPHDKQVISDFIKNIQETYFTLSSRGAGNWSARFYQVLYMGRIPIVVDTDLVMPFEDRINWRDIIVFCDSENDILNNIHNFWETKDIIQAQHKCKEIYNTYLSPQKWCTIIAEELLSKALPP